MKHAKGFSLIELQVVMVVGGLLASILFPAVNNAKVSASMTQTVSNGKCIYLAAFSDQMDMIAFDRGYQEAWPEVGDFKTSTAYFINLVTNGIMDVTYDFFAAEGIPGARTSDTDRFHAENNAWKLVLGLNGVRDGTPFIFTRNYAISTVPTTEGPILPEQLMDNNGKPFGPAGLVVVQKGGAAMKLTKKALTQQAFNPAGAPRNGAVLAIVNP